MAKIFNELGYYAKEKGTYHHLFDRLGAIRLKNVQEIFDSLERGHIVTILTKHHFTNIIGIRKDRFIIEDSMKKRRIYVTFKNVFKNIRIAWSW